MRVRECEDGPSGLTDWVEIMGEENLLPVPVDRSRLLPVPISRRETCPRDPRHAVRLRADGVIWCRGCDEAFYPQSLIWEILTQSTIG